MLKLPSGDVDVIIGIGIDIVDVERFAKRLPSEPGLKEDLFTDSEIAYCGGKARSPECLAARFAAKEAFLKAIGTGWRDGIAFRQISISSDELGKPSMNLTGKAREIAAARHTRAVHLSLSHEKTHAVAVVVLED